MARLLHSDGWAHSLPFAILAALIMAVALGGCEMLRDFQGPKDTSSFWDRLDRVRGTD